MHALRSEELILIEIPISEMRVSIDFNVPFLLLFLSIALLDYPLIYLQSIFGVHPILEAVVLQEISCLRLLFCSIIVVVAYLITTSFYFQVQD
jgi:hypothetical protein